MRARKSSAGQGFWDQTGPKPPEAAVHFTSSKLKGVVAFLKRVVGGKPKKH